MNKEKKPFDLFVLACVLKAMSDHENLAAFSVKFVGYNMFAVLGRDGEELLRLCPPNQSDDV